MRGIFRIKYYRAYAGVVHRRLRKVLGCLEKTVPEQHCSLSHRFLNPLEWNAGSAGRVF